MKSVPWLILISLLIFSCNPDDDIVPDPEPDPTIAGRDTLVNAINEKVSSLSSSNPTENFGELAVLDQLAGTRIIGMGEASHGTKEFFEMKHKVFRYFVENHGYRGIIMEADFGECLKANEYVLHGNGNIDSLMQDMHFWTWKTEEVKDMIEWMHDYNLGKPMAERIYYLGSDCQFSDDNLDLIETKISNVSEEAEASILQYSSKLNSNLFELVDFDLPAFDSMLLYSDSLLWEIESYQSEIVAESSAWDYDILVQLAKVSRQSYEVAKGVLLEESFNYRDKYMADNTVWWANQIGMDQNFMVWAHNYHVSKINVNQTYGGPQGGQLEVQLGDDYKAIGFSMARGIINAVDSQLGLKAGALPATPAFGSINELFDLAEKDNFIWVFDDTVVDNSIFNWFNEWREWMTIGSIHPETGNFYSRTLLFYHFDTVIHFNRSNPTRLIE